MKTYKQHYQECRDIYNGTMVFSIYDIALKINCVEVDLNLLSGITKAIKEHLKTNHDTSESKWGKYVNDFNSIPMLNEFCLKIVEQLESKYFNSFVKIENLHILENKKQVPLESSWVWHYDDCPREFLKLAVYLNDVGVENGPMKFVRGPKASIPLIESYRNHPGAIKGHPPPVFPKSRVPKDFVDQVISKGGAESALIGPMGTNFLFSPNIIHKGTVPHPTADARLAMFMFVRPSKKKIKNLIAAAKPKKANVNVKKYNLD